MNPNITDLIPIYDRNVLLILFVLLLILDIASIFCTLFILIFFFANWHSLMGKVLHNHAIFLLMVVSFLYITLDLPLTVNHYRVGYDSIRTKSFCLWWYWIDYSLVVSSLFLTAIASLQRHVLVFHTRWLHDFRKRCLLHVCPLLFCLIYPPVFYLIFLFFYRCTKLAEYGSSNCPPPCYSNEPILFHIDWMFNTLFPVAIIVVANLTLIVRVIYWMEKFRRCRSRTWKRRRRLTLQLLAFSSLYVLGWVPSTVVTIVQRFLWPSLYTDAPKLHYVNTSSYFVCPLQPFICFFALPKLMNLLKNKMRRRRTISAMSAFLFSNTRF